MKKDIILRILTKSSTAGIKAAATALGGLGRIVKSVKTAFHGLKTAAAAAYNASRQVGGVLKSGWSGLSGIITKAAGTVAVFTAAIGATILQAAKFNTQMARAWTMMGGGIGQFRKMRKEVRELSGDLGIAKDELANGLYQALSAGVPEDNVISFLSTAAKVAVADGSDVAVAVDGITTVLNAFKIEASKTDHVTDMLFTTVANGKTTFAELASSLSTAAPTAAALGVPLKEILAATASLTKQGVPTSQAMTQIRAAMFGLSKELGDGWSKSMSFQQALQLVYNRAGGSTTKLLKMLGTTEAVAAVLATSGKNAKNAAGDLDALGQSAGKLQGAFKKVDQFRHWQKLSQTIKSNMTRIGTVLDNVIKPVVNDITAALDKWDDNDAFFATLQTRLEHIRAQVFGIYKVIKGGQGGEVWAAVKDILVGGIKVGVEAAGRWLLKIAPVIGHAIGIAAKKAMTGPIKKLFEHVSPIGMVISGVNKARNKNKPPQQPQLPGMGGAAQLEAGKAALGALAETGCQMYQQCAMDKTDEAATSPGTEPAPKTESSSPAYNEPDSTSAPAQPPQNSDYPASSNPASVPSKSSVTPDEPNTVTFHSVDEIQQAIDDHKEQVSIFKDDINGAQKNYSKEQSESDAAAQALNDFHSNSKFNHRSFSYKQKEKKLSAAAEKESAEAKEALKALEDTKKANGELLKTMTAELQSLQQLMKDASHQMKNYRIM